MVLIVIIMKDFFGGPFKFRYRYIHSDQINLSLLSIFETNWQFFRENNRQVKTFTTTLKLSIV